MLYKVTYLALLLVGCGYAAIRGGAPERCGAAIVLVGMLLSNLVMVALGHGFRGPETALMWVDVMEGLALIWLSLKANRFWPMWAAMLQVDAVLTHSLMYSGAAAPFSYGFALWMFGMPLPALVGIGAIRHRWRLERRKVDRAWS